MDDRGDCNSSMHFRTGELKTIQCLRNLRKFTDTEFLSRQINIKFLNLILLSPSRTATWPVTRDMPPLTEINELPSTICIGENKGADQLRGNREADQRLCFR